MITITPLREKLWVNVLASRSALPLGVLADSLFSFFVRNREIDFFLFFSVLLIAILFAVWGWYRLPVYQERYTLILGPTSIEGPGYGFFQERQNIPYDKISRLKTGKFRWLTSSRIVSENKDIGIHISSSISDEDYNRILERLKEVGVPL